MNIEKVNATMKFIASYHELEDTKATEFGCEVINAVVKDIFIAAHLCDAWIGGNYSKVIFVEWLA